MMKKTYPDVFDFVVEKALKSGKRFRVVIAGADNENMLRGVFSAAEAGFATPVLLGDENKIKAFLEKLGYIDREYTLINVPYSTNVVQYAIDMIKYGKADILMRGNTETRDFLLPILAKTNHLIIPGKLLSHVTILKLPKVDLPLALSDVTVCVNPSMEQRKEIIRNMVRLLNIIGVENPNIALLSLVETPSFHMRDSVEAATLVMEHEEVPIAKCRLVGPIAYDLVVSPEAAKIKGYDCDCCGKFHGVVVPNLMVGNIMTKILELDAHAHSFGVIMGAEIPIAITSRSGTEESAYLSLAAAAAMAQREKNS